MSFLEERDLVRDADPVRRGREARAWLLHDERGRVLGLVLFSVAISITMSLLATAIVRLVSRRRAVLPVDEMASGIPAEQPTVDETPAGLPVMDVDVTVGELEASVEA